MILLKKRKLQAIISESSTFEKGNKPKQTIKNKQVLQHLSSSQASYENKKQGMKEKNSEKTEGYIGYK
jgi:hypothetical protein